jgi:transcriptional/translational regulatory protein YebC/TACO1
MFTHIGNVIVEKKNDLEQAIEDAINIDAEDVEEFKENDREYFRVCNKNVHLIFNLC